MEPVQINLPFGRSVRFRGTIDRVDLNPDRKEYRIVDYKSGDKKVNYASLYYGLSVQLPAYLHARPESSLLRASYALHRKCGRKEQEDD